MSAQIIVSPFEQAKRILPEINFADYGRRANPRFYVVLDEIDGGWQSVEYVGNRYADALAAIDRLKAERAIGRVIFHSEGRGR